MTTGSGYPNVVKLWKRGTPMADAKIVYTGKLSDVESVGTVMHGPGQTIPLVVRNPSFFEAEYYYLLPDGSTLKAAATAAGGQSEGAPPQRPPDIHAPG